MVVLGAVTRTAKARPFRGLTDEEHLEAIDELATVFNEDQDAQDLLDRISFPVPRRPVFYPDPRAF